MALDTFFIDVLADAISADFAARGVVTTVEVGEWSTFDKIPDALVILGLGDFEGQSMGADAHHYIGEVDQGDGTSARSLCVDLQRVIVWCAARAPATTTTDLARGARAATQALKRATIAALWRAHGGPFTWGSGKWLNESRGSRIYGAAARFECLFALPVWDDANPRFTPDAAVGQTETQAGDDPVIAETPDWIDP